MPKVPPIAQVYVFEAANGLIKIGHSTQPEQRLKKIQSASGFEIKRQFVSAPCYNYMEVEGNLQKEFAERRQQGKWFAIGFQTAVEALKRQRLKTTESPATQLVTFQFEQGNEIRTFLDEKGDPWFVAKDVCRALGITWIGNKANLSNIPESWRMVWKLHTTLKNQHGEFGEVEKGLTAINEFALYKLVFRSNKPEADKFVNWIVSEVLPSIRKTGKYEVSPPPLAQRPEYQDFGAFIAECFIPDPAGILASRDIYKIYQDWCKRYQRVNYTHKLLGQYLKESGYTHVRRTRGLYCWLGLRLKMDAAFGQKVADLQNYLSALYKITKQGRHFSEDESVILVKLALEKSQDLI
jgi:prophage antirepressor-like protein